MDDHNTAGQWVLIMDIKHTPGPWKRNHLTIKAECNGVIIAEAAPPNKFFRGSEREEEMEYCRGNARLMAAAPELLEALETISTSCEIDTLQAAIGCARAAIAKTTGARS